MPQHSRLEPTDLNGARATRRIVYHLRRGADDGWHLALDGDNGGETFATKKEGRQAGERLGRIHVAGGERARLVVHHADGGVDRIYTYGSADEATALGRFGSWLARVCCPRPAAHPR